MNFDKVDYSCFYNFFNDSSISKTIEEKREKLKNPNLNYNLEFITRNCIIDNVIDNEVIEKYNILLNRLLSYVLNGDNLLLNMEELHIYFNEYHMNKMFDECTKTIKIFPDLNLVIRALIYYTDLNSFVCLKPVVIGLSFLYTNMHMFSALSFLSSKDTDSCLIVGGKFNYFKENNYYDYLLDHHINYDIFDDFDFKLFIMCGNFKIYTNDSFESEK